MKDKRSSFFLLPPPRAYRPLAELIQRATGLPRSSHWLVQRLAGNPGNPAGRRLAAAETAAGLVHRKRERFHRGSRGRRLPLGREVSKCVCTCMTRCVTVRCDVLLARLLFLREVRYAVGILLYLVI